MPVCTREFFGIPKPCAHWEEVTLGRARVFSFQNKPGKKHTGLNPALLPRCFLCLDLPGNSSGFKKPSIQWEEFTPIHARDFSAQHKPGPEAHRLEPGASAQVFYVPGFTREFLGIKKPGVHWEEVTPGRTRDFSSQHKPGLEITWQQPSACAQVVPVPGFTRHYTSTMPPGNSRRRSCSWGLPGASRGVLKLPHLGRLLALYCYLPSLKHFEAYY